MAAMMLGIDSLRIFLSMSMRTSLVSMLASFRLKSKPITGSKSLANRGPSDLLNSGKLVLTLLDGLKNDGKHEALMLTGEILLQVVVWIDTAKAGHETWIQAINELVAEADGKDGTGCERAGSSLQVMIIVVDGATD